MRYSPTLFYLLTAVLLSACSPEAPKVSILTKTITLEKGYQPVSDSELELENRVSSLTAYLFNGDKLVEVYEDVPANNKSVSLELKFEEAQPTHLYFVANTTAVGKIIPGSISRSDFLRLEVEKQTKLIPDYLVLAGGVEIAASQSQSKIPMNRGMARLDMNIKNDLLFVKKFTITNTQREQFLFPKSVTSEMAQNKVTFADLDHTFEVPQTGKRAAVGYINEQQNDNLRVQIDYQYNGVEGKVTIAMPSTIARNSVYQIELDVPDLSLPDKIVGSVNVIDWDEGTGDVATPETNGSVKIIAAESTLPDASELDAINRRLHLSFRGGEAVLALDGLFHKRFELVTPDSRLSIASVDTPFRGSKLTIKALQTEQGEAYRVRIKVYKEYIATDPGVEVTVDVDANCMPTVRMGGLTWMAYNGVGSDLSLYPPLDLNQTVREVYAKDWKKYSRMMVWGPRPKQVPFLYPWEFVRTTQPAGSALTWPPVLLWALEGEQSPCPEGWRLPTFDEMKRIWPAHGLPANGTYTNNKIVYKSSTMPSGASVLIADDKKTEINLQLFVIREGENELVFPMVGWRRRDDYAGSKSLVAADVGKSFYLWTQNKGNQNWSAKAVGVLAEGKSYLTDGDTHQAMTEAYNTIRCVKNE